MVKNYTFKLFDEEDEFVYDFCFNDYLDLCNTISSLESENLKLNKKMSCLNALLDDMFNTLNSFHESNVLYRKEISTLLEEIDSLTEKLETLGVK